MDVLKGPYYWYCKNYLSPFGLWPLQNGKTKFFLRTLMLLFCFTSFIPHLSKAYELRHHFHYFLLSIPSIIFYVQYITKFISMIVKDDKCRKLLELIKHDFQSYEGEALRILHQYAKQAKIVNTVYVSYFMSGVIMYNLSAFAPLVLDVLRPLNVTRHRRIPRLMKYNIKRIENNFFVISIHGFVFDIFGIMLVLGFDALILNCSQHACALFQIVVVELKDAINESESIKTTSKNIKKCQDSINEKIIKVIKMHKHAIDFVDLIESTYATANFIVIGILLGSITLTEFETVQFKGHIEIMFRFALFTSGELLHILFHNYPGQRIQDHSLKVYQSCYQCEWYRKDVSIECKKLINLMMLRSQRPSYLTGGGLYVLDLQNYASILKASLSYFTFLSSV